MHKGAEHGEKGICLTTEETPEIVLRTGTVLWDDLPSRIAGKQIQEHFW